ncbi:MAG: ATP-binding protein [Cyclobacteriaceae bacterium]
MATNKVLYSYDAEDPQKIHYLSPGIESLSGCAARFFGPGEAKAHLRQFIHPEDRPEVEEAITRALACQTGFEIHYRLLTADRQEKSVREQGWGQYDQQGKPTRVEGCIEELAEARQDHSAKKHSKQAARPQQDHGYQLYATIAHYFPNTIIAVVDEQMRLLFVDGEEASRIGLDQQQTAGQLLQNLRDFPPQWKKLMVEHVQEGHHIPRFSYEVSHKDQFYMVNGMPLRNVGNELLFLFFYTNISEQKRTEVEMINALKKERELGELKSRFVSMASHEFRTPLSTILSSANLIARQNEPGRESQRIKNVERIKSSVRNLVDILNEFLSLGRLEQGKVSMHKEEFDLIAFMRSIVQELQHAQKPGQRIHIVSSDKVLVVHQDKQFIRNIFLNLVSNALKYSPEGRPVEITISTLGEHFNVKVIDQGVGIPEDEHKHLFDLFFRARNATNIEGTGLGLPIVKKFIDLMQGEIAVESQVDHGTTFSITLPVDQVQIEQT